MQAGEGQHHGVVGLGEVECLILGAAGAFVTHQVGVGAAQARGSGGLVRIHHDMVLGGLFHSMQVMVVHILAVVMLATRNDVAHIAGLHSIVTIFVHQLVGIFHIALIVGDAGAGLVVHEQLHSLAVGILVEHVDVKVGVGDLEVKHIILPHAGPVFPTGVPALHEHLAQVVAGGKVDVSLHIGVVGAMAAVGAGFGVVGLVDVH